MTEENKTTETIAAIETDAPKRVPRTFESIRAGALALKLKERVDLKDQLQTSINEEITRLKNQLNDAENIVKKNGTPPA
jgi:hypothetical protein